MMFFLLVFLTYKKTAQITESELFCFILDPGLIYTIFPAQIYTIFSIYLSPFSNYVY